MIRHDTIICDIVYVGKSGTDDSSAKIIPSQKIQIIIN